jgi:hypothetical protein
VEGEGPLHSINVEFGREEWIAVCCHLYPIFPRPDLTMVRVQSRQQSASAVASWLAGKSYLSVQAAHSKAAVCWTWQAACDQAWSPMCALD